MNKILTLTLLIIFSCLKLSGQECLVPLIQDADSVRIEQIDSILRNRNLWFDHIILGLGPQNGGSDKSLPPSLHYNYNYSTHQYDLHVVYYHRNDNLGQSTLWFHGTQKSYRQANLLEGGFWSFFPGKFIGIEKRPLMLPKEYRRFESRNYMPLKLIKSWPDSISYIKITPCDTVTYRTHYDYTLAKEYKGREIPDTIFIPYTPEKIGYIFDDNAINYFDTAFRQSEREMWARHMSQYKTRYESLKSEYGAEIANLISNGKVLIGFTESMCNEAFELEPYKLYDNVDTPLGNSYCKHYYTRGIKMFFIDGILIGIQYNEKPIKFR